MCKLYALFNQAEYLIIKIPPALASKKGGKPYPQ